MKLTPSEVHIRTSSSNICPVHVSLQGRSQNRCHQYGGQPTSCNLCCRWSQDLYELLRPAFPGQLPRLGRNLLNAVFLVNPGTLTGCRWGLCKTLRP